MLYYIVPTRVRVAQLVEHHIHNVAVAGSKPAPDTSAGSVQALKVLGKVRATGGSPRRAFAYLIHRG